MIRKAVSQDIPHIKKITEACARHMIAQGIFQWNENYPDLAVLTKDVKEGPSMSLKRKKELLAVLCSPW